MSYVNMDHAAWVERQIEAHKKLKPNAKERRSRPIRSSSGGKHGADGGNAAATQHADIAQPHRQPASQGVAARRLIHSLMTDDARPARSPGLEPNKPIRTGTPA